MGNDRLVPVCALSTAAEARCEYIREVHVHQSAEIVRFCEYGHLCVLKSVMILREKEAG